MSDSQRKLARLKIPTDLTGKSLLDIGCNEGYFCRIAKERGASRVIGIDFSKPHLEYARSHYGNLGIEFRLQNWNTLPEGPFDYILWTSAMHYEADPKRITRIIRKALSKNGLFILECGLFDSHSMVQEMRYVVRHSDVRVYPTRSYLLNEILFDFAVREVSHSEITEGDPVPRAVFHCREAKPEIIVVLGSTGIGKSSFVQRHFAHVAAKVINLDYLVSRLCQSPFAPNDFVKFVQQRYNPDNLRAIYAGIDEHKYTDHYISLLLGVISPSDRLTVLEGYFTDLQLNTLKERVGRDFLIWQLTRPKGNQ